MSRGTFCVLLMTAFSVMLGLGIISPFLPEFAEQHGANGFWLGMIFAGFGISRGLIMPIVGKVSDRTGRKIFVTSGLFLFTVISLFYPVAEGVFALTVIRLIHGLAAGMIMPIVVAYIGELAEEGKEGATTGALNMMFYFGFAAGPVAGGFLDDKLGFDAVFHAMAALGAITFLLVLLFMPETKRPVTDVEEYGRQFSALFKYNFIKAILIIAVISTLMMAVFVSFVPSLAEHKMKMDAEHVGLIISVGILLAGALQVPFGKVADRIDRVGRLIQIGVGTSVGMFAVLAVPYCPGFWALLTASAFVGIGAAVTTPAVTSISVHIGHRFGMGSWMGIVSSARSLGFVLTPLVFGVIMDRIGINAVFYVLALLIFFGGLGYAYYVHRRLKGYKQG